MVLQTAEVSQKSSQLTGNQALFSCSYFLYCRALLQSERCTLSLRWDSFGTNSTSVQSYRWSSASAEAPGVSLEAVISVIHHFVNVDFNDGSVNGDKAGGFFLFQFPLTFLSFTNDSLIDWADKPAGQLDMWLNNLTWSILFYVCVC